MTSLRFSGWLCLAANIWVGSGGLLVAEDNQLVIIDGISTNFSLFPHYVGETGTNNFLIITNAGSVTSAGIHIGEGESANWNQMIISGVGSKYPGVGGITVGRGGDFNRLVINDGATATNSGSWIGALSGSDWNEAIVTGPGSTWAVTQLTVGWSGSNNRLVLSNGGTVTGGSGSLGGSSGSHGNSVEVSGGAVWNGGITVGTYGYGNRLWIRDGGTLTNGSFHIGSGSRASNNVVIVSGAETRVWGGSAIEVGDRGSSNLLQVIDGAVVAAGDAYIAGRGGSNGGSDNRAVIRGEGSLLEARGDFQMATAGSRNSVSVDDGGGLVVRGAYLDGDESNKLIVNHGYLEVSDFFELDGGTLRLLGGSARINSIRRRSDGGTLLIDSGRLDILEYSQMMMNETPLVIGTLSNRTATVFLSVGRHEIVATNGILVGSAAGAAGELFIAGGDARIEGPMHVGNTGVSLGRGMLHVSDGATIRTDTLIAGEGSADVIVNSGGVFEFTSPTPDIRSSRPNSILLENATVGFLDVVDVDLQRIMDSPSGLTFLGGNRLRLVGSVNDVVPRMRFSSDSPTEFKELHLLGYEPAFLADRIEVGEGGKLSLNGSNLQLGVDDSEIIVEHNGEVSSETSAHDFNPSVSTQLIRVDGPHARWENTWDFAVGNEGSSNSLIVTNGGRFSSWSVDIGRTPASVSNRIEVIGSGSSLDCVENLHVGHNGDQNQLLVRFGSVAAPGGVWVGRHDLSEENSILIENGTMTSTNGSQGGFLRINGGNLVMNGGLIHVDQFMVDHGSQSPVAFHAGTIRTSSTRMDPLDPFVVGDGIQPAVFRIDGGTHRFTGGIVISQNAMLVGNGLIEGPVENRGIIQAESGDLLFTDTVNNTGAILIGTNGGLSFGENLEYPILEMTLGTDGFEVSIGRIDGRTFSLEFIESLKTDNWMSIGHEASVSNGRVFLVDTNLAGVRRFYRVRSE